MKTTEERAEKAWVTYEYQEGNLYSTTFKAGYVLGANEQKGVDINKVCVWLSKNYEYFDGRMEDFLADFSKAMEE